MHSILVLLPHYFQGARTPQRVPAGNWAHIISTRVIEEMAKDRGNEEDGMQAIADVEACHCFKYISRWLIMFQR
jgi:hypothetical protein